MSWFVRLLTQRANPIPKLRLCRFIQTAPNNTSNHHLQAGPADGMLCVQDIPTQDPAERHAFESTPTPTKLTDST